MKITMKTLYATPDRSIAAGATADLPDAEARDLIDKGYAVPAGEDPTRDGRPGKRSPARQAAQGKQIDPSADPDAVPDGTVDQVMVWVSGDQERAARALQAEQARGDRARSSLVDKLTAFVESVNER